MELLIAALMFFVPYYVLHQQLEQILARPLKYFET
jgi:hypothetical protein